MGCTIGTCTYNNLPFIAHTTRGILLSQQLLPYGPHNATFWILSIHYMEFSTVHGVITFLKSKQHPHITLTLSCCIAKGKHHSRKNLEENRAIFNQIRFLSPTQPPPISSSPTIVLPILKTTVTSPTCPDTLAHIGQLHNNPSYSTWKVALFKN